MESPRDFLMRVCNNDGKSTIYYKIVEYKNDIKVLSFEKALNLLKADIQEMKEFFSAFGITDEEKVIQATYQIWMKHLYK